MSNDSTPGVFLPPDFNAIPLQLKSLDQWFLWRAEAKPGEPGKFKKRPRNLKGVAASKNHGNDLRKILTHQANPRYDR